MKTPKQMWHAFAQIPAALQATLEIAERCQACAANPKRWSTAPGTADRSLAWLLKGQTRVGVKSGGGVEPLRREVMSLSTLCGGRPGHLHSNEPPRVPRNAWPLRAWTSTAGSSLHCGFRSPGGESR